MVTLTVRVNEPLDESEIISGWTQCGVDGKNQSKVSLSSHLKDF